MIVFASNTLSLRSRSFDRNRQLSQQNRLVPDMIIY